MEKSEKPEKLHSDDETGNGIKVTWRHYLIFPVVFGIFFALVLNGYVRGEWTQLMIRKKYFPHETANFSGCENTNTSDPLYKKYETVQQEAAEWSIYFALGENIPNFIAMLILPPYIDVYGRKFLLIMSVAGMAIKCTAVSFIVYFEGSFWYFFASNVIDGMSGAGYGFGSAAFSYTADLTLTKTQRTIGVVVTESCIKFAVVLGSYCSGLFVEDLGLDFFYTSVIGGAFSLFILALTIILPESLPKHKRSKPKPITESIKNMTAFYVSKQYKGKRSAYILLLAAFGVATIITVNRGPMETLYLLGRPFCWGPSKIGMFRMVCMAAQTVFGLIIIWPMQKYLSNATIGVIGCLSGIASYIVEAFATTTVAIYMVAVSGIFIFLIVPMIRSLMSALTPLDQQGTMFAGGGAIEVTFTLIGSLTQNAVYSFSLSFMNGFVFLMLGGVSLINLILMFFAYRTKQGQETYDEAAIEEKKNEKEYELNYKF